MKRQIRKSTTRIQHDKSGTEEFTAYDESTDEKQ